MCIKYINERSGNMIDFRPKLFTTLKGYTRKQFFNDFTAGIIVSIIALPLSIALAIASGVSPEKGLYTAIIGGFLISALGGSRVQIGGPTGAFMVIVYGVIMQFGMEGLVISTILAGIIMILIGLFKLGNIIKFVPYPIITGFTAGIAVIIFSSQVKDFLGLKIDNVPADFIGKWKIYFSSFNTINIDEFLIGIIALLTIIYWPKINRKVPSTLIALILTATLVIILGLEVSTIGTKFGALSSSLPTFNMPNITFDKIMLLIGPAITIAILGSIESLLSAVVSDGMINGNHRSNTELIAQGIANVGSGLFGGIPATGAIARTAANVKSGGRTPVAGIIHSVSLLLILLVFMPLAKMVPLASLAAILIVVSYNMSEWRKFVELFNSPKSDVIVLIITFIITILVDLVTAIEIGIVISALFFIKRMNEVSNISITKTKSFKKDKIIEINVLGEDSTYTNTEIYEMNGPFFFGVTDKFINAINQLDPDTKILIIKMGNVPVMDATALNVFKKMIDICKNKNIKVKISGINNQPLNVLKKSHTFNILGEENFFNQIEDALEFRETV